MRKADIDNYIAIVLQVTDSSRSDEARFLKDFNGPYEDILYEDRNRTYTEIPGKFERFPICQTTDGYRASLAVEVPIDATADTKATQIYVEVWDGNPQHTTMRFLYGHMKGNYNHELEGFPRSKFLKSPTPLYGWAFCIPTYYSNLISTI